MADDVVSTSLDRSEFRTQCSGIFLVAFLSFLAGTWLTLPFVISGVLVFADAWIAGIRRQPDGRGLYRVSPLFWGIFVEFLAIVALPLYLLNRNRLRAREGSTLLWVLTIIVGGATVLLFPLVAASLVMRMAK